MTTTAYEYEPDASKFPSDPAEIPARLENMRPGQIRDATARGAICLLPVGVIEAGDAHQPLGIDPAVYDRAIEALAAERKAVIAPPIWFGPTGYILSGPDQGTVHVPAHAFSRYIQETLITLGELGFQKILIVILRDPQGASSALRKAIDFALGDLFNNFWKEPDVGRNWWIRPDFNTINWARYSVVDLPKPAAPADPAPAASTPGLPLPLRLEAMTPAQLALALKRGLPCYLPIGVLENHGNQNPIGCDAIEATDPVLLAASKVPCVVAPTIWYGPTAYAVSGPEIGSTDINGQVWYAYIRGVVDGLAAIGFHHVVLVQCHQGGGAQRTGIELAVADYNASLYQQPGYGPGWRQKDPAGLKAPRVLLIPPPDMPLDHAGKNETSWMLVYRPKHTRVDLIRPGDYPFCWHKDDEAIKASVAWGQEMSEALVERWTRVIKGHM